MAKEKKSVDPLAPRATKVTKTTRVAKQQHKVIPKSSERISDSDLESDDNVKITVKPAKTSQKTGSQSKSSQDSVKKASEKPAKKSVEKDKQEPKSNISKKVPVTSKSVTSEDEESSDDSSESEPAESKKVQTKANAKSSALSKDNINGGAKTSKDESSEDYSSSEGDEDRRTVRKSRKMETTSRGEDSSSDGSSSEGDASNKPVNGNSAAKPGRESHTQSDSDSDEDDASDEEMENAPKHSTNGQQQDFDEDSSDEEVAEASLPANGTTNAPPALAQVRPSRDFQPPSGFQPIDLQSGGVSGTSALFDTSSTTGKQIWYISAPSSLPITALKSVPLDKFAKGEPVMTHEGAHYALIPDPSASTTTRVLLPGIKGYKVLPTQVNNVLQFQQVVQLPAAPQAQQGASSSNVATIPDIGAVTKPMKAQPKGLKMRFRPTGFGDGDLGAIGSSDEEEEEARPKPAFRVPETASLKPKDGEAEKKRKDKKTRKSLEEVAEKNARYAAEATRTFAKDQATAPEAVESPKKRKTGKDEAEVATPKKSRKDKSGVEGTPGSSTKKEKKKGKE